MRAALYESHGSARDVLRVYQAVAPAAGRVAVSL